MSNEGRYIRTFGVLAGAIAALCFTPIVAFGQTSESPTPHYQIQDLGDLGGTLTKAYGLSADGWEGCRAG